MNENTAGSPRRSPLRIDSVEAAHCDVKLKRTIVRALPFFVDIDDAAIEEITPLFREMDTAPGQRVYTLGHPADQLLVVAHGYVKLMLPALSGQEILVDMLSRGEFFGRITPGAAGAYAETAISHTACCLLRIGTEAFGSILKRHPETGVRLLETMAGRLASAQERLFQLSAYAAEGRIASTLLRLAVKFGEPWKGGTLIQLPLSREELASLAAVTTETASRVISRLSRAGIVRSGRRWMAVFDEPALRSAVV